MNLASVDQGHVDHVAATVNGQHRRSLNYQSPPPFRVTRLEQRQQLRLPVRIEPIMSFGQQPAAPVQRVVLVAPVADRFVLHPPTTLIDLGVGVFVHVKRVRDLGDMAEAVLEGLAVRARHVQHPHRIAISHASGCSSSQALALAAVRPSITSTSFGCRPGPPTSTIDVYHCLKWRSPSRKNNVSSKPNALTVPTRSVSVASSASP